MTQTSVLGPQSRGILLQLLNRWEIRYRPMTKDHVIARPPLPNLSWVSKQSNNMGLVSFSCGGFECEGFNKEMDG